MPPGAIALNCITELLNAACHMAEVHGMVQEHDTKNIQLEVSVFLLCQHNEDVRGCLMLGLPCIVNAPV